MGNFMMDVATNSTPNNLILNLIDTLHWYCWCQHCHEHYVNVEKLNTSDTISIKILYISDYGDVSQLFDTLFIPGTSAIAKQSLAKQNSQNGVYSTWKGPDKNYLIINLPEQAGFIGKNCFIFDMHGRVISKHSIGNTFPWLINTTHLGMGNYIIQIEGKKTPYWEKITIY
jgi:hypothetical protein